MLFNKLFRDLWKNISPENDKILAIGNLYKFEKRKGLIDIDFKLTYIDVL